MGIFECLGDEHGNGVRRRTKGAFFLGLRERCGRWGDFLDEASASVATSLWNEISSENLDAGCHVL
jgi:hypothetical protein